MGDSVSVRVLEPSPPFDDADPDYLADDPVTAGPGVDAVVPVGDGDGTWDAVVSSRTDLAGFARERWLTSGRELTASAPDGYHEARVALHQLAVYVLSPTRMAAIGKMALRHTHHGFGTPFFGDDDRQVRVEGGRLVDQTGATAVDHEITSLSAAAEAIGIELDIDAADSLDVPPSGDVDRVLEISDGVMEFLADWYGFATRVLEGVRAEVPGSDDPSRVQLWPEHFDPAFEAGDEKAGRRAGFGASPGDHHDDGDPEPYLYVSLWRPERVDDDAFWNAPFGAKLPFAELVAGDGHEGAALDFFRTARRLLAGS